jgi:Outer membrane protein beta-barrel domain
MKFTQRAPLWLLVVPVLLGAALPASADAPRFELTPFVGGRVGGGFDVLSPDETESSVDLGSGASFGLDLGMYRDRQSYYQLLYSTQQADIESRDPLLDGIDVRIDYLQFGGTAFFPQDNDHYVPYLSLTIGATFMQPDDDDYDSETKFSGSIGGGFRFPLSENLGVNLGVRGYLTLLDSDTRLFCNSDADGAQCLVQSSGSTLFQAEAQLGLAFRF